MHEMELPRAGAAGLGAKELSRICQQVFAADQNRLQEGKDFKVDLQQGKRPNSPELDTAPDKLISFISQEVWRRPSYDLFWRLLDNYTRNVGVAERITPQKEQEISNFLDHALQSGPFKVAHEFLLSRNLVARELADFKSQLYQMWFRLYTREARDDTCGFEHVFVGESKHGEITGLHNWLQFYNLEQNGNLDYRGYIFPRRRGGQEDSTVTAQDQIISVQFNIDGQAKDVSSIWLGTSPECELALYTICFVAGGEKNIIELPAPTGVYEVEIRCYHIHSKYGDKVGSAFPVLLSKHPGAGGQLPTHWPPQQQSVPQSQQAAWQQPGQQHGYQQQVQQPQYAQQDQQGPANQGCGNILAELLKAIFSRLSK